MCGLSLIPARMCVAYRPAVPRNIKYFLSNYTTIGVLTFVVLL